MLAAMAVIPASADGGATTVNGWYEELDGFAAIDDSVVVRQRNVHHRPRLDLPADDHWAFLDRVHSENAALRRI